MIKMPVSEIIDKIVSGSSLTKSEVEEKIKSKMTQLSGLISEEGAAHIIANELNIKLFDLKNMKLRDIAVGMRNIEVMGKVINKYELREFNVKDRKGSVASMLIGDETAVLRLVFWNDKTSEFEKIKEGDIVKVSQSYVKDNNGRKEVHVNDKSEIVLNPEGVSIEVKERAQTQDWERKSISNLDKDDQNAEILATIVQVYDLRFFEKKSDGSTSYVLNLITDDGTGTIRTVFWQNQIQRLLNKSNEEILKYKESPTEFEAVKHELLGEMIKLQGRVQVNSQLGNLEFVPNFVISNPDPGEEIKKIAPEEKVSEPTATQSEPQKATEVKETNTEEKEVTSEKTVEETKPEEAKESQDVAKAVQETNKDLGIEEDVISIDELDFDDEK